MHRHVIASALSIVSLVGCAQSGNDKMAAFQAPGPSASDFRTKVFYGGCTVIRPGEGDEAGAFAALGAAILPSLISTTLSRFGTALRRAGEAETTTVTADRNIQVEPGRVAGCVQFVRGTFAADAATAKPDAVQGLSPQERNRLPRHGIFLADAPDIFIEARVRRSENGAALAFAPTFLEYNRLLKGRAGATATRGLVMQMSVHPPGETADGDKATGANLPIGNFRVGTVQRFPFPVEAWEPFGAESPWFPTFAPPQPAASAKPPTRSGSRSGSPAVAPVGPASVPSAEGRPSMSSVPLTLTVSVAETRDANQFLLFLADVFDGSKASLQNLLEQQLIEEKRDAARIAASTKKQEAVATFYAEFGDA